MKIGSFKIFLLKMAAFVESKFFFEASSGSELLRWKSYYKFYPAVGQKV